MPRRATRTAVARTLDEVGHQAEPYFRDTISYDPAAVAQQWKDGPATAVLLERIRLVRVPAENDVDVGVETIRDRALDVFGRLARAEAQAHRISAEQVHFHEVGALDAIVDILARTEDDLLVKIGVSKGMMRLIGVSLGLVILSVILLSSAGIYSLMSFTVARRRREIGIRAALGANRNRILAGIFSRVLAQLGAGAALGLIVAVGLEQILEGDMVRNYRAMLLPLVVLLTMTIGIIAAIGPVRQGLRIQPIEALRDE